MKEHTKAKYTDNVPISDIISEKCQYKKKTFGQPSLNDENNNHYRTQISLSLNSIPSYPNSTLKSNNLSYICKFHTNPQTNYEPYFIDNYQCLGRLNSPNFLCPKLS